MAKLVSKTYGEALLALSAEEGREEALLEEIVSLKEILKENPEFGKLMNHPKILKEEKLDVLNQVFKGRLSDDLTGLLHIIVMKDRYGELDAILDYITDAVKKQQGIGVAYVTTAMSLTDGKQKEIEEKLLQTTSFKRMEMHYAVDSELIGGMVIRIGDRVVDSSIRTALTDMRRQLLHSSEA